MKRLVWILLFGMLSSLLAAQSIRIGLFYDEVIGSVVVHCTRGEYTIWSGEQRLSEFRKGDILFAALAGDSIEVHTRERVLGKFRELHLRSITLDGTFRIRPTQPAIGSRSYDDELLLRANDGYLDVINQVDFDKYLAGVLETEVGPNAVKELYKVQALLTRTYAMDNYERHREEGFSLCDAVHCQAYKGRSVYNPEIPEAVFETTGEVVADFHYRLIEAVYHSNSGGQTQRASDVWMEEKEYLQAVVDPYSLHQPSAKWSDTISFADWKEYLLDSGMESVKKIPDELLYIEQMRRKRYFILDKDSLLMTKVRKDWNWRSSFFDMFPEEDGKILVWGKGYGHGVGLSQEGAMKMARDGYNYRDIIKFYYYNVRIMNYEDLPDSSLPDLEFWR